MNRIPTGLRTSALDVPAGSSAQIVDSRWRTSTHGGRPWIRCSCGLDLQHLCRIFGSGERPTTVAPFNECPGVGHDSGCAFLIILNPNERGRCSQSSEGPFDVMTTHWWESSTTAAPQWPQLVSALRPTFSDLMVTASVVWTTQALHWVGTGLTAAVLRRQRFLRLPLRKHGLRGTLRLVQRLLEIN